MVTAAPEAGNRETTVATDEVIGSTARDPLWLPHRYDPGHDAVHFRRVDRAAHAAATFLTDQHLGADRSPRILRRAEAVAAARGAAGPLHFVFHSAFCCSTLVARAFDRPGWAMGLKEPVILNDLVGWRRRGATGAQLKAVLADALTLLARPFGPGEAVVVKPSNVVNGLAMAMMELRPDAHALLMSAPLPDFLASIAKKGLDGRLFVRELFLNQLKDGMIQLGFDQDQLFGQTDLQIAAMGWLAQAQLFQAMAARFGPRVRTVASDALLADPRASVDAMAALFGLARAPSLIEAVASGPAFSRHSKDDTPFGREARAAEYAAATGQHADEIGKVIAWTHTVADRARIPLDPGTALHG